MIDLIFGQVAADDGRQGGLILFGVVAGVSLLWYYGRRWLNNRPDKASETSVNATDTSLIITMYTMGVGLQKASEGTLQGYHYSLLVTNEIPSLALPGTAPAALPDNIVPAPAGQVIMRVNLPTTSEVHFAGFSLQDSVFRKLLGNINLDDMLGRVQLEGDFPDYFRLYCDKGKEIELLEVLDPTRMAFLIDFCQKFNWELFGSDLYFVHSNFSGESGDDITIVEAAEEFAQKILPTLQRMSAYPRGPLNQESGA